MTANGTLDQHSAAELAGIRDALTRLAALAQQTAEPQSSVQIEQAAKPGLPPRITVKVYATTRPRPRTWPSRPTTRCSPATPSRQVGGGLMATQLGTCYLLCIQPPYHHAAHYAGWTADADPTRRIGEHLAGRFEPDADGALRYVGTGNIHDQPALDAWLRTRV